MRPLGKLLPLLALFLLLPACAGTGTGLPLSPDLLQVLNLQGMLFLLILAGVVFRKLGVIDDTGVRCLTDLCIQFIIPCNIIKSFLVPFQPSVLRSCALLLLVAFVVQAAYVFLNKVLYRRCDPAHRKILQYATICTNASFLGNPVAEGLYGDLGLLYNSVFLFPMRVVMWSAGLAYFTEAPSRKDVLKKVVTHPCLVAVYIGLVLMVGQISLPPVPDSTVRSVSSCTAAVTMLIIGASLADVDIRTIFEKTNLYFSFLRLVALPLAVLILCRLLGMDSVSTGVAVLMTGMPAGSTTAIFAARYHSDAPFAAKCVVLSTLLSMVTIPAWRLLLGG